MKNVLAYLLERANVITTRTFIIMIFIIISTIVIMIIIIVIIIMILIRLLQKASAPPMARADCEERLSTCQPTCPPLAVILMIMMMMMTVTMMTVTMMMTKTKILILLASCSNIPASAALCFLYPHANICRYASPRLLRPDFAG